jgi:(p)ppGpp synthase/HD superfamily hydrolase
MDEVNINFEVEWREQLIARLKKVVGTLKSDSTKEKIEIAEAKKNEAGYATVEEAHEAYGWAYITEKQYDRIAEILNGHDENRSAAALARLTCFINDLRGEVNMIQADSDVVEALAIREK